MIPNVKKRNGKHHFVPQSYLRQFASGDNLRQISLYNFNNEKLIQYASIKDQAYVKFLYGKDDELEKALCHLEGYFADIIRKTIQFLEQPPEGSVAYKVLLEFV